MRAKRPSNSSQYATTWCRLLVRVYLTFNELTYHRPILYMRRKTLKCNILTYDDIRIVRVTKHINKESQKYRPTTNCAAV